MPVPYVLRAAGNVTRIISDVLVLKKKTDTTISWSQFEENTATCGTGGGQQGLLIVDWFLLFLVLTRSNACRNSNAPW